MEWEDFCAIMAEVHELPRKGWYFAFGLDTILMYHDSLGKFYLNSIDEMMDLFDKEFGTLGGKRGFK